MEKKKEERQRRKEEMERREQLGSSPGGKPGYFGGKGNATGKDGKSKKAPGGPTGANTSAGGGLRSEDSEVQIPPKLRELIEDSDDDYPLYFKNPDQLLEMFAGLEEKNLFLIQQGQDAE